MSQQPPPNPANGSPSDAELPMVTFGGLAGNNIPNTDDAPTIISKTPPTQNFLGGPESSLATSLRGRSLAHFELLEPIGVGGMAAVFRARDKQLDRFVALKILPPEMAVDPEHVLRFHQEARAAAKLDHENIARVYFCGEDQKLHFIAFEFVEGQNLRTVMERGGEMQVKDAVHYMLQIATGLAHAAARGVVHRDIKPSNIIIMPNGRAKLVDMGLARSMGPQDNRQLTQSGVTLGTFDYISPEQALEPRDADVRSDIYSLGCTFYHMLTGQPPVPDGTAAKKLHHHQHVAPIDPRQLNPEIPDEVAAILQRMMAKDAKDRYQRAEHLVQHLLQVAQKLGGADVPDGVLFVDAPLPGPPQKRPLVLATLAIAVLGIFILAVAIAPPHQASSSLPRSKVPVMLKGDDPSARGQTPTAVKELLHADRKVANEQEFAAALAEDSSLTIVLQKDIHSSAGLSCKSDLNSRRTLTIESEKTDPVTIQFTYVLDPKSQATFWAGLTVEGGSVTFKNVRFVLEAGYTPPQLVAGVAVKSGQVVFDHCTFAQETPQNEELIAERNLVPIASVAALNTTLGRPPVVFHNCWFPSGQAAVSVKGSARVRQDNCAFGPHACLFHIWGQDNSDKAELILSHVSAQVVNGPVFRLDENVSCALDVRYSIFSSPPSAGSLDRPDFIRQTSFVRDLKFEGKRNAYHQLLSFLAKPGAGKDEVDGADWKAFKNRFPVDGNSSLLMVNPWHSKAGAPLEPADPKTIFAIDLNLPELRQENEKKNHPIGVEVCATGPLYTNTLQPPESSRPSDHAVKPGPHERFVDPVAVADERVHKKIESAILEAEPDDVILIKFNGELKIEPTAVTEGKHIRLRPYQGYQPILILGKTTEKSTALFHLHHSQIDFEQLDFVLRPDSNQRGLAVVSMGGDSTCKFDQCVITLDSTENAGVDLDVVTLLDPRETMKSLATEAKLHADVKFKGCLVRGRGDLVGVRASRPLDLDVDGSLVCLAGSLLTVHPLGNDAPPADARCFVRLHKTTTYLAEPALHLTSSKMGRGLVFTQLSATNCLFAAQAAKPLVRLDGLDNENQLKKVLAWSGTANAYAGFDKLLEQSGLDAGTSLVYQSDEWKRFTDAGTETRFDRAALQLVGGVERSFTQLSPGDFPQKTDLANFGAAFDALPRPAPDVSGQSFRN